MGHYFLDTQYIGGYSVFPRVQGMVERSQPPDDFRAPCGDPLRTLRGSEPFRRSHDKRSSRFQILFGSHCRIQQQTVILLQNRLSIIVINLKNSTFSMKHNITFFFLTILSIYAYTFISYLLWLARPSLYYGDLQTSIYKRWHYRYVCMYFLDQ